MKYENNDIAVLQQLIQQLSADIELADAILTTSSEVEKAGDGLTVNGLLASGVCIARTNAALKLLEGFVGQVRQQEVSTDSQFVSLAYDCAEAVERLRPQLAVVADRYARSSAGLIDTDPNPKPLPPAPDPFCLWICEWLNRICLRTNPDCLLTPCEVFC